MMFDRLFGIHEQALHLRAYRSQVLASNLANADTPGYKARDFDFRALLRRQSPAAVRLAATHSGHIQPDRHVVPSAQMQYRIPHQPSLDGNTVEVEREQSAFSENAMRYQATLRFIDSRVKGIKKAFKGSGQ
jgi:flagellar basal-body rod protein FlgB